MGGYRPRQVVRCTIWVPVDSRSGKRYRFNDLGKRCLRTLVRGKLVDRFKTVLPGDILDRTSRNVVRDRQEVWPEGWHVLSPVSAISLGQGTHAPLATLLSKGTWTDVYAVAMNPFRSRLWRTIICFLAGIAVSFVQAVVLSPYSPDYCAGAIVGAPCQPVATQTMAGYLIIALGFFTIVLGPIAASMLDVAINGARWEMPRGRDTVVTNMPLLVGAIYLGAGVFTIATA
jgi:hypothetical protein